MSGLIRFRPPRTFFCLFAHTPASGAQQVRYCGRVTWFAPTVGGAISRHQDGVQVSRAALNGSGASARDVHKIYALPCIVAQVLLCLFPSRSFTPSLLPLLLRALLRPSYMPPT